eukprot:SAG31_NODE_2399_length_5776_cov_8.236216_2_plen_100_part_00
MSANADKKKFATQVVDEMRLRHTALQQHTELLGVRLSSLLGNTDLHSAREPGINLDELRGQMVAKTGEKLEQLVGCLPTISYVHAHCLPWLSSSWPMRQ